MISQLRELEFKEDRARWRDRDLEAGPSVCDRRMHSLTCHDAQRPP
jgi:hypothetical protein